MKLQNSILYYFILLKSNKIVRPILLHFLGIYQIYINSNLWEKSYYIMLRLLQGMMNILYISFIINDVS